MKSRERLVSLSRDVKEDISRLLESIKDVDNALANEMKSVLNQTNKTINKIVDDQNIVKKRGSVMAKKEKRKWFTMKEKKQHYSAVANNKKHVKLDSKFSPQEQRSYAKGQLDARNESDRIYAYKKATELEKAMYKHKKEIERKSYKESKNK